MIGDNKIKFLALYLIYNAKFLFIMRYFKFIVNLILSIVALFLISLFVVYCLSS